MKADFPRILTLLRKERGISQKKAAEELEISQALLSHYEKGIRECGLDFIIKAAAYYQVSCDYLLGRSPQKTGNTLTIDDIPETDASQDKYLKHSMLPTLNKRLLSNSLIILFDLLDKCNNKSLTNEVSTFLMLSVYRMFRTLYGANPNNNQEMFKIHPALASAKAAACMAVAEANVKAIASGWGPKELPLCKDQSPLEFHSSLLENEYKPYAASLLNVIQNSEKQMEN